MLLWQALSFQTARQHYNLQLKRRVWLGWHSLVQKHWKIQVEQACRAKAEEVCSHLSMEYEGKLAEVNKPMRDWIQKRIHIPYMPHHYNSIRSRPEASLPTLLPISAALWDYREGPGRDSETASRARTLRGVNEESLHEGYLRSQHGGSWHVS